MVLETLLAAVLSAGSTPPEAEAALEAEVAPEVEAEAALEAEAAPEVEAEAVPEAEAEPKADAAAKSEVEPEPEVVEPAVDPGPPTLPPGPPGGYWSIAESHERAGEPKDGEEALTIGSVLLPLGLIRGGAGAINVWMAGRPDLCPASDEAGCNSFAAFGWSGVAEGGLMVVTGIVYLAIGASQKQAHQRWKSGSARRFDADWQHIRVDVAPWLAKPLPGRGVAAGGGLRFDVRF